VRAPAPARCCSAAASAAGAAGATLLLLLLLLLLLVLLLLLLLRLLLLLLQLLLLPMGERWRRRLRRQCPPSRAVGCHLKRPCPRTHRPLRSPAFRAAFVAARRLFDLAGVTQRCFKPKMREIVVRFES
jgi:hypothetical protein